MALTKLCKCGHKKGDHNSWSESSWIGAYLGTNYSHCNKCGSVEKGNLEQFNCRYFRPVNCVCQKLVSASKRSGDLSIVISGNVETQSGYRY